MAFLQIVDTITQKKIVPGVVDNVFKNSLLLSFARRDGLRQYQGGPSWQENFLYDVAPVVGYAPGDTFDLTQKQFATGGTITPRYYNTAVVAFAEKIRIELNGPQAVFDYVDHLFEVAAMSMSAKLSNDAYRHGQNLSGSDRSLLLNGLDEALNDGSTNGFDGRTYANYLTVARSSVNNALDSPMTSPAASVSGAISYDVLEQKYSRHVIGPEEPNMIITTNLGNSYIKMQFQAQQRFETSTPELGFRGMRFNGATIFADQYCPGTRTASTPDTTLGYSAIAAGETIWFLNTKYIRFYVSTDPLYGFGFTGFVPAQDNSVLAGHYKFCGNLTYIAPRLSGLLYAVTG